MINWQRCRRRLLTAIGTFAVIALAGFVVIWVWAATVSAYKFVAFITCMFAVTGATMAVAVAVTAGPRNRAMIAAMLGAGLRVSEVVALMAADVDFARGELRVNLGKDSKDRVVLVDTETLGWLRAWSEKWKALGLDGRQPASRGARRGPRPFARRRFFCAIRRTALGGESGFTYGMNLQAIDWRSDG